MGAYIYLVYHLEKFNLLKGLENEEDKVKLSVLAFLFSNTILLHHSPSIAKPSERILRSQFLESRKCLERYLEIYHCFPRVDISEAYFQHLNDVFHGFEQAAGDFALFALLRLNFSLLTAADYLATGQYSYDLKLEDEKDWGILTEEQRRRVIEAAENEKDYNKEAYYLFRKGNYSFQSPLTPSEDNLNLLRKEMAVKVLQQLEEHKDKRLFYLEAPTGGGKTNLSMLAVAELLRANPELNKVFYVFPFTTLITQTHKSIKEALKLDDEEIALLHNKVGFQTKSGNEMNNLEEAREDGLYGNRRRDFLQNLFALYPFILVTHVRFFDMLKSNGKEEAYLMHRLANSVVVLDELQSYNPRHWDKMMYMLDQYGKYFNIRFILMSATLPRLDKIKAVRDTVKDMPIAQDLLPDARQYFTNPNFKGRVRFNFELMKDKRETTLIKFLFYQELFLKAGDKKLSLS
ncbi:MAG: DEAD/DEAH box helicase [Haliscomenobacter sp.]|nr:DEAD/DEAH box helicase [Haliscomenobacter sp.]